MKKLLSILVLIALMNTANSQEKIGVAIMPFTVSDNAANTHVNSIIEVVSAAFVKAKRFNVIERSKFSLIEKEKKLQKTEDFMDSKVLAEGKQLGAQYLILGNVNGIKSQVVDGMLASGNTTKVQLTLKVVDVVSSQVIASENIESTGGAMGGVAIVGGASNSGATAVSKAISNLEEPVVKFITANFPLLFEVIEVQESDKKGTAKVILVAGGSDSGVKVGDTYNVVEQVMMEVGGQKKMRNKPVGKIKIKKIEDGGFSVGAVTEGGTEIGEKIKSGTKLKVSNS